jgi:hypothetical protein
VTHAELVDRAERWLLSIGCGVTFTELSTAAMETPDVIGWKSHMSILIEVKASRSDFYRDKRKPFRRYPERGMGCWRFFMCEAGVILPGSLPEGWGLLYVDGNAVRRVCGVPAGNANWGPAPFKPSRENEILMLLSALRRLKLRGYLPSIYEDLGTVQKPATSEPVSAG